MTIYLVDTNILIDALNHKRGCREMLNHLVRQGHRLACCTVTLSELFSGIKPADITKVEQFVAMLSWYQASRDIARRAGQLRASSMRGKVLPCHCPMY